VTYANHPMSDGHHFDATRMRLTELALPFNEYSHAVILFGVIQPDACVRDPAHSRKVNVESLQQVITDLQQLSITPVFLSTEVVFDGEKGDYRETERPTPGMLYAQQKVEVENWLAQSDRPYIIARLAKIYDSNPNNGDILVNWLQQVLQGEDVIRAADDYISSAIHIDDAIAALVGLMQSGTTGLFHVGGPAPVSRLAMCEALFSELEQKCPVTTRIESCSIDDFLTLEKRPRDVSLCIDKVRDAIKFTPRSVRDACRELVQRALPSTALHRGRSSSSVSSLRDSAFVREDRSGRTPAYFFRHEPARLTRSHIEELKEIVLGEQQDGRICLHADASNPYHDMVIVTRGDVDLRPHKHSAHGETWHLIEGRLGAVTFNDEGVIMDVTVLSLDDTLIYRIPANLYHAVVPLSPVVVFHEGKTGPFVSAGDSLFPSWAPADANADVQRVLKERVLAEIRRRAPAAP
jgi:dTDP-4-dehydrorhamnose reductase